jgi:hypothetical protein
MKKNLVLAALVAVAAIFAGCEKKEPTAVLPENLNAKVVINGYVRSQAYEEATSTTVKPKAKKDEVANAEITVLYGVLVGGEMTYKEYKTTTNKEGFYQIELGCAAGKVIDEVKVQAGAFVKDGTKAVRTTADDVTVVTTDAYFYGEAHQYNAAAGNAYKLNVLMTPVDLTSYPDLSL